jgi:hypothetical protein
MGFFSGLLAYQNRFLPGVEFFGDLDSHGGSWVVCGDPAKGRTVWR